MSLMGSLYVGSSGLRTSQNALNTTAHNMANVNTEGYVRQIVMQGTRSYNTISVSGSALARQQLGLGVVYSETKTQRDLFLDKSFRRESGRSAFYEVSSTTLQEIEDLLQELDGEAFANTFNNLWTAVQDLANEPDMASRQSIFIQRCYEFLIRAESVYQGFSDYQDNMNASILADIDQINTIGRQIKELNDQIRVIESGNKERANDQRNVRDRLIDELSSFVNISYDFDAWGNITIKIEGNDFVKTDSVNEISVHTDPVTGFYTPYWQALATIDTDAAGEEQVNITGAEVFNLNQTISSEMNTDIGSVKSKLLARGTHRATYQDIVVSDPNHEDFDPQRADHYDRNISQSIIMNMQAQFDRLINLVVEGINNILFNAAGSEGSTYLKGPDGKPLQVFQKIAEDEPYTIRNIIINNELRQAPTLLGFRLDDGQADFETTRKLKELFDDRVHTLNPNVQTKVNLAGFYNAIVSQVANSASVSREIANNQQITVDAVANAREQVIGVSTDEELSFMIQFQNAFNASSRYVNVISEMLEHLVTQLGRG